MALERFVEALKSKHDENSLEKITKYVVQHGLSASSEEGKREIRRLAIKYGVYSSESDLENIIRRSHLNIKPEYEE